MDPKKFYVTTPIYYVNDRPHIGHAYTTILADVLARYHRLFGVPTHFLTGTDEHGQKVQKAAEKAGITGREQADRTVVRFQELWQRLGITHDDFIRTTEPRHTAAVQAILKDLWDRGEIYRAEYDGWYDVTSETFVTEKDLPPGQDPAALPNIIRIKEANYFFRMSKYQDWLVAYIESHPDFIRPESRRNETLGFLRKPLQDLCISRPKARLAWGIELPFDRDYVCYVWFDALCNYLTAIGYAGGGEAPFRRWWPASVQLIGKDILTTHTVYWPTMLRAMGVEPPETVFAHGWWLLGGQKMSKSAGNVVNPMDMADAYGVDAFRYFLIAEMTLGQDATFSEEAFAKRFNADLANDLGNLASRLLNLMARFCGSRIPALAGDPLAGAEERGLWDGAQAAVGQMVSALDSLRLDQAVGQTLAAVKAINRYFEVKQPWTLGKEADKGPVGTVLYVAAECLRVAAALLYPIMPSKMTELREALGLGRNTPAPEELRRWGVLSPGTPVAAACMLFPRIQPAAPAEPEAPAEPAKPRKAAPPAAPAAEIELADFAKVELRTAKVISAEKVPGADRLLRLQVDVGGEIRQIVAGIALHYTPEELPGKTVIVVANLKPASIRGVESRGMLLAASADGAMKLLTVAGELPSGARAK